MEEIQLKDICDLDNGYAFKSDDYVDNSNTLNCRMSNIRPDGSFDILYSAKYLPDEFAEKYKDYILHDGDLIIAMTDMAGDPKILGVPTVVDTQGFCLLLNQRVGRLRFIRDGVNADYLKFALQCPKVRTYLKRFAGGGVQLNVSKKDILSAPVCMRNEEEQNHIAGLFKRVLEVKTKREQELQLLDDLIKARFVELFGDPKLNDKGWNAGIVSDYYEVKGGKRIPKGMGYANGVTAHPYLRATDMKNETILDDDIHYIDEEVYEHIKRYTVKGGDIYLTNVGVNLGMAGVIPEKYDGANLTENAVKLVPKTEKVIDGIFFAHYINSPGIQDYINERKMSVGAPKLAIFRIETMPLLLPPMDIQMQFIEFCKQVDKSKIVVKKALNETQLLFESLMQKYFG